MKRLVSIRGWINKHYAHGFRRAENKLTPAKGAFMRLICNKCRSSVVTDVALVDKPLMEWMERLEEKPTKG